MVVLITGATGFIGGHLAHALLAAGERVVAAVRDPSRLPGELRSGAIRADFAADVEAAAWLPRLAGIDVVVNAVGILRERPGESFSALHRDAPKALFAAAAQAGVARIVQISALGADEDAGSDYHRSKRDADRFLATLGVAYAIAQPSLVYGVGGASARLFNLLAAMPFVPLPGQGSQRVQPVHIDDLVAATLALMRGTAPRTRVALVGPEPLELREFLGGLRRALGLSRARFLPVPMPLVRLAARAGDRLPGAWLDSQTLAMLERGNTADAAPMRELLARPPRGMDAFVTHDQAPLVRLRAQLDALLPVLRVAIATVWIATGIVSLGIYPVGSSDALLARVGIEGALAAVALYGAALLDLALGVATLAMRRRRWLWAAQIVLILAYTALITWRLPEFWLHPFGPILKNVPMLAALWLLHETDR